MESPLPVHQGVVGLFYLQIGNYIRNNKGKGLVWLAPFDVQLDCDNRTMVEPDLVILCDEGKMRRFGLYGAPDFVLEVLSPSTRRKDMFLKAEKYEHAGVREYWIVDPQNKKLIVYNYMEENIMPQIIPISVKKGPASAYVGAVAAAVVFAMEVRYKRSHAPKIPEKLEKAKALGHVVKAYRYESHYTKAGYETNQFIKATYSYEVGSCAGSSSALAGVILSLKQCQKR